MKENNEPIGIAINKSITDRINALRSKLSSLLNKKLTKTINNNEVIILKSRLNELQELRNKITNIYIDNYSKNNPVVYNPIN